MITPEMLDERVDIGALTKHWEFYHPIPESLAGDLKSWGLKGTGTVDALTSLKIFSNPKNEKTILVAGVDDVIQPPCIVVDDWGEFRAEYEPSKLAEIIASPRVYIKAKKKIVFSKTKWEVDIYEEFICLPEALIYDKKNYIFVSDDKVVPLVATLASGDFPCPMYDLDKIAPAIQQPSLPLNGGFRSTNEQWWQNEGNGNTYFKRGGVATYPTTLVVTKQCCAYNATEEYLKSILGINLAYSDRNWYVAQDRVETQGLPLGCTLEVLNELVAPYGVEIYRVWVNEFNWTEELTKYSETMLVDNEMYRMMREIAPMPDPRIFVTPVPSGIPVVSMAKINSAGNDGHASYLAPRSPRSSDWKIALDYRRIP